MNDGSKRIAYWDNLKAILIFLVVLGHFLLPVIERGRSVSTACYWIYSFHMPAFVFVSGVFSKKYASKTTAPQRPLGFLTLYLVFKVLTWLVSTILTQKAAGFNLFRANGAPWYMLCMFYWYLLIPVFGRTRPSIAIPLTVLISLLIGTASDAGLFLGTSLCIVFFPFFLLGYHFQPSWIERIKPWMRVLAALILLIWLIILFFFKSALDPYLFIIYGSSSYGSHALTDPQGIAVRLIWTVAAAVISGSLMCVVPTRNTFFTYIGGRTLSIYIFHRLIRDILQHFGIYDHLGEGKLLLLACILLSIAVTFLTSGKRLFALTNSVFRIPWTGRPSPKNTSPDAPS